MGYPCYGMESVLGAREAALQEARILGVRVHRVRMAEALEQIEQCIRGREPSLVITADANAVLIALEDAEFRALLERASLITADGAGLLWAGRDWGSRSPSACRAWTWWSS